MSTQLLDTLQSIAAVPFSPFKHPPKASLSPLATLALSKRASYLLLSIGPSTDPVTTQLRLHGSAYFIPIAQAADFIHASLKLFGYS